MKKILTLIAAAMAVVTLTVNMNLVKADANDEMKEASCVSFVIPSQFEPGLERGLFVNKQYPMESSTIQYDCYNNGKDELLTNKEKQALAEKDEPVISDESLRLSKEIFEDAVSRTYNEEYGEEVGYSVSSFNQMSIDGYPGYKIEGSFKVSDQETVYQTVYMILSKYKTFTITYQRAEDDDCEDLFADSQATIHVH